MTEQSENEAVSFVGEDLQSSSFAGKDLGGAVFRECNLQGCDFSDAVLDGADFFKADLLGAKFCRASLVEVDFRGACLDRCDFTDAKMDFANLRRGIVLRAWVRPPNNPASQNARFNTRWGFLGRDQCAGRGYVRRLFGECESEKCCVG